MKKKKFDCVQMKHEIQQQLMKEFEGLSYEEQWAITEKRVLADPILGPFWKNAHLVVIPGIEPEPSSRQEDETRKACNDAVTK
jgi:hypothetical protein